MGNRAIRSSVICIGGKQHSRDGYHGLYLAMIVFIPALLVVIFWQMFSGSVIEYLLRMRVLSLGTLLEDDLNITMLTLKTVIQDGLDLQFLDETFHEVVVYAYKLENMSKALLGVLVLSVSIVLLYFKRKNISPRFMARHHVEKIVNYLLICAAIIAVLTTAGIILSLVFETMTFFEFVSVKDFLFGTHWSPQTSVHSDEVERNIFGIIPLLLGTLLITIIAMFVAIPIGLMAAIYLSEYASIMVRNIVKPALEILAGIPTVVYGFFAILFVAPLFRQQGVNFNLDISSESAIAAGLVMGVMIIPFISSLADDMIASVPKSLREGAYALGSTQAEVIKKVVLPAALPGLVSAVLLAVSRAIGETMIVVMAAGVSANLTINPLESVTTVTVQIVMLLVGDQEFDSPATLVAFALGLVLFFITLGLNIVALYTTRKYREQYE